MGRFLVPSAVFVILKRGHEVLLAQRINTGHEDGNFGLVAGHIDAGESATQALIREAGEEAGIVLHRRHLRLVHMQHYTRATAVYIDWFFEATRWTGEPRIMEPEKCGELRWCDLDALPGNTIGYIRQVLDDIYTRESNYSEWGWDPAG